MKKLDKILDGQEGAKELDSCSCDSCSTISEELEHEEGHKRLFNNKTLIVIGFALTVPIVIFEVFFGQFFTTDYIVLALATPVQILLGRSFYVRFYNTIRYRRPFTTDTLVILSTSVAYGYSLVSMMTGSGLLFFEASASVLTIFTLGEYLEGRVLKSTSESIRRLLDLKPKTATVIRNGKEQLFMLKIFSLETSLQ